MTISEMISKLQAAKRALGDVDVTFVADQQYQDVQDVIPHKQPTDETRWCFAGPVVVLDLTVPS